MFDLQGQENFVKFTDEGLFPAQKEIAGDLHGDSTTALTFFPASAHQLDGGTYDPAKIDAGVFEKAIILSG